MDIPGWGIESELQLQPMPQQQQRRTLNPLCPARESNLHIPCDLSYRGQILNPLSHGGNPHTEIFRDEMIESLGPAPR